jgi:hypothetical protein
MDHDDPLAPIRLLLQAILFAEDTGRNEWDFAVEISNLRQLGLNESHFRWFVCRQFVEHAEEITSLGDDGRSFRPTGRLTFTDTTCFVLTQAGAEFARELLQNECIRVFPDPHFVNRGVTDESQLVSSPHWDSQRHELTSNGQLVKRFKHRSPNQETVLTAFQEERWPSSIRDPLPPVGETDPKRRLSDTIRGLNHHQKNRLLHFRGDGTGEGIIWEFASKIRD